MYYLAKLAQAAGLAVVAVGFLTSFPQVMNRQVLVVGVLFFGVGWMIQKFMIKN